MSVPEIIFGRCPVCGDTSADYAAASLTPADSQSNLDVVGNGTILEYYQGELMCEVCKKTRIMREESELSAEKHAEEDAFRAAAGFVRTVT